MLNNLNKIFKNISAIHTETKKVNTRTKKLSIHDALLYQFKYSCIYKTKQSIVSDFNYKNDKSVHRTTLYRKENNISLDFYRKLYLNIKEYYDETFKNKDYAEKIDKMINNKYIVNNYNIFAVDGTNNNYLNNHELISNLNMCVYSCNDMVPIDMFSYKTKTFKNNKNNESNKNNEVNQFIEYINKNKITNAIFVCDRAYFKYQLFDLLEKKNLKYVIRIKENCKIIDKNYSPTSKDKNYECINSLKRNPNVEIIKYDIKTEKVFMTKTNDKKRMEITNKYHLITNLPKNEFNDEKIKNIYNSRWNIEVFFKILKNNCKFSYMKEKCETQHIKLKYIELIMMYITKMLIYYGFKIKKHPSEKITKRKNTNSFGISDQIKVDCQIKVNYSNLIDGIYNHLLPQIIAGDLEETVLEKFINSYLSIHKNENDRSFLRKSILPFSKWYVKMYHNKYEYNKIISAVTDDTIDDLNKNLKLKSKSIKILNI